MKNLSLGLNIVLIIAVAFLYYLHFSGKNKAGNGSVTTSEKIKIVPVSAGGIVYVNSDSLIDQYHLFKTKRKELESSQEKIKNELKTQGEKLQHDIEEYQQTASGMTDQQRQTKEEGLALRQQQFVSRRDEALARLDKEQEKSQEELYDKIGMYLKEFNKDKNYQFILGYQKGGGILFANDSLNVTRQVIDGLNQSK